MEMDVLFTKADEFGERVGRAMAVGFQSALADRPILTGVRPVGRRPGSVRAWLKERAGLPLADEERRDLMESGWGGSLTIDVPRNAVTPLTRSEADETIPQTMADRIITEIDTYAFVRQVCRVITTARMDRYMQPILDDRANTGILLTGDVALDPTPTPAVTGLALDCKTIHSQAVPVSKTVLLDSAYDLESELASALGARIGRKLNALLTNGTGASGQPYGVVTAAPVLVTTAETTGFDWREVFQLVQAVDPAYRTNAVFMMHPNVAAGLWTLTDQVGRPILWLDPTGQKPKTLFGYPVIENPDMPSTVQAGRKLILFGDFSRYILRERSSLRMSVLQETFVTKDAIGFIAFYDFDAGLAASATTKAIGALQIRGSS